MGLESQGGCAHRRLLPRTLPRRPSAALRRLLWLLLTGIDQGERTIEGTPVNCAGNGQCGGDSIVW